MHLFAECTKSSELWRNVKHWVFTRLSLNLDFDNGVKIFGYNDNNENLWPLNFMLIVQETGVQEKGFQLNIFHLQREILKSFNEQKISSFMNNSNQLFEKRSGKTSLLPSKVRLYTIEYMYFLIPGYSVASSPLVNGVMILA